MTATALEVAEASPPRTTVWSAVLLLAAILFAGLVMKTVFSPLQEAAKLDLKLSDFSISLVQGLATGAPITVLSIPLAWIIDHGRRVRLFSVLMLLCAVGAFWSAFATNLPALFMARMLTALGASCSIPVAISLVADFCAPELRGRAMVLLGLGATAGTAAAFVFAGGILNLLIAHPIAALGGMAPWRGTLLVLAVAGAVLLLPLLLLREPERHEVEERQSAVRATLRALWAKRGFLVPLFVGQIGVSMADTAAGIWATPVLIRVHHLQPTAFAGWLGVLLFGAGALGSIIGGFGADLGHKSGRRGGLLLPAVLATAAGVPTALFPVMSTVLGFQLMFFILVLAGAITAVVASVAIAVLIPNEERGACLAAFSVISSIVAVSLAPTIVTVASSLMGGERFLAPALAATGVAAGAVSLAGYIQAMRKAPRSATNWN